MGEIEQHPETTWKYWFDPGRGEVRWGTILSDWTDDWDVRRLPNSECEFSSAWFSWESARALADWILNPPEREEASDEHD